MPRIRRLKNYEQFEEQDTDINGENERNEYEYGDEKGWWSTRNIISTLSDAKLKTAITYYKETLHRLEAEMVARNTGLKSHINKSRIFCIRGLQQINDRSRVYNTLCGQGISRNKNRNKTIQTVVKKLKLSPTKQGELLRVWSKILEEEEKQNVR